MVGGCEAANGTARGLLSKSTLGTHRGQAKDAATGGGLSSPGPDTSGTSGLVLRAGRRERCGAVYGGEERLALAPMVSGVRPAPGHGDLHSDPQRTLQVGAAAGA